MLTHQIVYFTNGFKKTIMNITGVKDGEFCHLKLSDGRKFLINRDKVLCIEIIPPRLEEETWGSLKGTYSACQEKWGVVGHSTDKNVDKKGKLA